MQRRQGKKTQGKKLVGECIKQKFLSKAVDKLTAFLGGSQAIHAQKLPGLTLLTFLTGNKRHATLKLKHVSTSIWGKAIQGNSV